MAIGGGKFIGFVSVAAVFTSPILAGIVFGHLLDEHFHTDPWLTITLLVIGFISGTYNLVRMMRSFLKEHEH